MHRGNSQSLKCSQKKGPPFFFAYMFVDIAQSRLSFSLKDKEMKVVWNDFLVIVMVWGQSA